MRLLLWSDLHCDVAAARRLVARAEDAEVVVGAGDFATCRRGLASTLEVLRAIDRPAVVVPGNSESAEELAAACSSWPSAHVLHGSGVEIGGVSFYGLGGGVPTTPFGAWSWDFTEEQAEALLAGCPEGGVLVSHSPPQGTLDVSSGGQSLGSAAVRRAVERARPALVVCGHIHESGGRQARIGETIVVNAGPRGVEINLP